MADPTSDPATPDRLGFDWECWPDLRVTFHLPPWAWRLKPRLYVDGNGARSHWSAAWLFLVVEWWGQDPGHPLFPRKDPAEAKPGFLAEPELDEYV